MYEFGADEISFYSEGFTTNYGYDFVSKPLYVADKTTGLPQQFSKVVMDVCETTPENTSIDYYVAASNDSTFPVMSGMWISIDPITRSSPTKPILIELGASTSITIDEIPISYEGTIGTDSKYINPARTFTRVSSITGSTPNTQTIVSSSQRYSFTNENERILSYEISTDLEIVDGSFELWRNSKDVTSYSEVRDIVNGWGFSEPYYYTAVYVSNLNGVEIDIGSKYMVIDDQLRSGKYTVPFGKHLIKVLKDQWKEVLYAGITTLAQLKAADSLYPYNHRYLVEGFNYPGGWSTSEEKIYTGFDIVAQYSCQQVSVFDLINNVKADDYSKFAIDLDAEDPSAIIDGSAATKPVSRVILLKVDAGNTDFINEKFLIKCKIADTLYKYLRLKAIFKTTDTNITPFLDTYRIKLSG